MGQDANGYFDGLGTGVCTPGATGINPGAPAFGRPSYRTTGAPVNGVNEVQTLSITGIPDGGTFTATFGGQTTTAIPYDATAAVVQAALRALSTIGALGVTCTGGPLPGADVVITFVGPLGGTDVAMLTTDDSLTGGTDPASAVAETTKGVAGSFGGVAPKYSILVRDDTDVHHYNTGASLTAPTWTIISNTP